jgi:lipopolysaccharide export system permease protein
VAIASRKVRGGTGVHLFLAVIIGFTFIFLSKITAVAALKIGLPVLLAVWIPNITFGILGVILYRKAQK